MARTQSTGSTQDTIAAKGSSGPPAGNSIDSDPLPAGARDFPDPRFRWPLRPNGRSIQKAGILREASFYRHVVTHMLRATRVLSNGRRPPAYQPIS